MHLKANYRFFSICWSLFLGENLLNWSTIRYFCVSTKFLKFSKAFWKTRISSFDKPWVNTFKRVLRWIRKCWYIFIPSSVNVKSSQRWSVSRATRDISLFSIREFTRREVALFDKFNAVRISSWVQMLLFPT